jgi:hypothetical protein
MDGKRCQKTTCGVEKMRNAGWERRWPANRRVSCAPAATPQVCLGRAIPHGLALQPASPFPQTVSIKQHSDSPATPHRRRVGVHRPTLRRSPLYARFNQPAFLCPAQGNNFIGRFGRRLIFSPRREIRQKHCQRDHMPNLCQSSFRSGATILSVKTCPNPANVIQSPHPPINEPTDSAIA